MFNFHFSLSRQGHLLSYHNMRSYVLTHNCFTIDKRAGALSRPTRSFSRTAVSSPHIPHAPLRCFLYQPQWQPYQHQPPIKISSYSCYRPPPRQQQILILLCIGTQWTRPIWRYLPLFLVSSDDYLVGGTSWPTYVSTYIYVFWHMSPY